MKVDITVVNAFVTDKSFSGNPAAVIVLDLWLSDEQLQDIALQNNLSETAYLVKREHDWHIRWFTPGVEVKLCGHATLAACHTLRMLNPEQNHWRFHSLSGPLEVHYTDGDYELDFPADIASRLDDYADYEPVVRAIGLTPKEILVGRDDLVLVYPSWHEVKKLSPNHAALASLSHRGVLCTAPGQDIDFVYRGFFAPSGIDEDPATGSAQTVLVPYWAKYLNRSQLTSLQLSHRKGKFDSTLSGDRVLIRGRAQSYLSGTIEF